MEYEGSSREKEEVVTTFKNRLEKIQLALGFNKAAMFNSPLD